MNNHFGNMHLRLCLILAGGGFCLCVAYWYYAVYNRPRAPIVPVVSACDALRPGIRRIGNQYGLQFDVVAKDFRLHEGTEDAAPFVHAFYLQAPSSNAALNISFGTQAPVGGSIDRDSTMLERLETREILDSSGHSIGKDYWGYLETGERWRRVSLVGGIVAKYSFISKKDAALFDRAINSVCILSPAS
jgi:hypothetical protein